LSEEERVFDLEQPRTAGMTIHPAHRQAGYSYLLHRHHEDEPEGSGPRSGAAGGVVCGEHTGTHIDAENLMLEELAGAGRHCFTFVCAPLKLVGVTGSPVRPLAIIGDDSSSGEGG
jgi:kynurenine formamidase